MSTKRKHEDLQGDFPIGTKPHIKKGSNKQATYAPMQRHAFAKAIQEISDWSSLTVSPKHVQLIYWLDIEGIKKEECAERYRKEDSETCSVSNIFRMYNRYAPAFYAEKGVKFIALSERRRTRAAHDSLPRTRSRSTRSHASRVDLELQSALNQLPEPDRLSKTTSCHELLTCASRASFTNAITPFTQLDGSVTFICRRNGVTHGSASTGPTIPVSVLSSHSQIVQSLLLETPSLTTIYYSPEIDPDTISRFNACITPALQFRLPAHVSTPSGTFAQQWAPSELEDLYVFAVTLAAWEVCDLVIDKWAEELRRAEPRVLEHEDGDGEVFDVLGFGPELLAFLQANDERGFNFLLNLLGGEGRKGWERLDNVGLSYWPSGVKEALLELVKGDGRIDLRGASGEEICARFHHHGSGLADGPFKHVSVGAYSLSLTIPDFPDVPRRDDVENDPVCSVASKHNRSDQGKTGWMKGRIEYTNPMFNTHHDSVEVREEKLRMVREKLKLFEGLDTELSGEEIRLALDALSPGGERSDDEQDGGNKNQEEEEEELN